MKKILVVVAHPDDEVLGCGGTIAKMALQGYDVYTLIIGEGITSRDEKRDRSKRASEIKELKRQLKNANKILGIKESFVFDFPDNRFDTVALLDIVKVIEKIKKQVAPNIIFTHHHGDLNIDHQITFRAAITACRPVKGGMVREIYSFEIPSSTEWNTSLSSTYFMPNYFVDISKTLKTKINALKQYKSEIRKFPHPRSPEAVEIIARKWGIQVGLEAAEAFINIRSIQ
jgi:LmbE family N-acetylglucosaminyl deacetylase